MGAKCMYVCMYESKLVRMSPFGFEHALLWGDAHCVYRRMKTTPNPRKCRYGCSVGLPRYVHASSIIIFLNFAIINASGVSRFCVLRCGNLWFHLPCDTRLCQTLISKVYFTNVTRTSLYLCITECIDNPSNPSNDPWAQRLLVFNVHVLRPFLRPRLCYGAI